MKKDRGAGTRFCEGQSQLPAFNLSGTVEIIEESYLKLVLARLSGGGGVEEIDCENLLRQHHVSP